MPIRFPCEDCGARIRVPDGSEGRKVRCPKCATTQRVPESKADASPPVAKIKRPDAPEQKSSEPETVSNTDRPDAPTAAAAAATEQDDALEELQELTADDSQDDDEPMTLQPDYGASSEASNSSDVDDDDPLAALAALAGETPAEQHVEDKQPDPEPEPEPEPQEEEDPEPETISETAESLAFDQADDAAGSDVSPTDLSEQTPDPEPEPEEEEEPEPVASDEPEEEQYEEEDEEEPADEPEEQPSESLASAAAATASEPQEEPAMTTNVETDTRAGKGIPLSSQRRRAFTPVLTGVRQPVYQMAPPPKGPPPKLIALVVGTWLLRLLGLLGIVGAFALFNELGKTTGEEATAVTLDMRLVILVLCLSLAAVTWFTGEALAVLRRMARGNR